MFWHKIPLLVSSRDPFRVALEPFGVLVGPFGLLLDRFGLSWELLDSLSDCCYLLLGLFKAFLRVFGVWLSIQVSSSGVFIKSASTWPRARRRRGRRPPDTQGQRTYISLELHELQRTPELYRMIYF